MREEGRQDPCGSTWWMAVIISPRAGNGGQPIYYDYRDRAEFLRRLEETIKRYGVEIHGYVLMPNHYHLLMRTPKANASEAMQWLNNGCGMWWNRKLRRVGGIEYSAVSEAVRLFGRKLLWRAEMRSSLYQVLKMLKMET